MYRSCLVGVHDEGNTTPRQLRQELNEYLINHPEDEINGYPIVNMIRENILEYQLKEYNSDHPEHNFSNPMIVNQIRESLKINLAGLVDLEVLYKYSRIMSDATPNQCEYGGLVELHAFSKCRKVNIVVYNKSAFKHDGPSGTCKQEAVIHYADDVPIVALLWVNQIHYDVMTPVTKIDNSGPLNVDSPSSHEQLKLSSKAKGSRNCPVKNDDEFMSLSEIQRLMKHLAGMKASDLRCLYEDVSYKLAKRNGYVVDFNYLLTSILGTNTNSSLLGGTEQSKGATFYVGPYTTKNKTELNESLDVVLEAIDHAHEYPSTADDKDTDKRFVQYIMTRILNKLNSLQEISDTQAASALLGLNVGLCSEIFVTYNADSFIQFALDERKRLSGRNDISIEDSDFDSDVSTETSFSDDDTFVLWNEDKNELEELDEVMALAEEANKNIDFEDYEPVRYYDSQYGSCKVYQVDNDTRYEPIANPLLYRYRGEKLKGLNRLEYFCTVKTVKDPSEKDRIKNASKCQRRPKNHQYKFSEGIPIHANHHQIMRTKSCTPKLFTNPPSHPGHHRLCCDKCNEKKNEGNKNMDEKNCNKCNRLDIEWKKKQTNLHVIISQCFALRLNFIITLVEMYMIMIGRHLRSSSMNCNKMMVHQNRLQ